MDAPGRRDTAPKGISLDFPWEALAASVFRALLKQSYLTRFAAEAAKSNDDALQKIKFHVLTKIRCHGRIKFAYFGDVGSVRLFLDTPGTTAPLR